MLRICINDGKVSNVSPSDIGTYSVFNGSQFGDKACAKSGSTNKNTASGPNDQQYTPLLYAKTGCLLSVDSFDARSTSCCVTCFAIRLPMLSNPLMYGMPALNWVY